MAGPSSISSAHSHVPSHVYEATDLKAFDFQTTDQEIITKYAIHKFNLYEAANDEDFNLWTCIQVDFEKFEARHFDELDGSTWKKIMSYCYSHGYWIDNRIGASRTRTTAMLEAVAAEWNNEWTLEQIEWVEKRYHSLSRTTRKRKQELTSIPHLDSASNPELNTSGQGTQQYQDMRYQTPPQQPAYVHQLTSGYQPTHGPQYAYESQFKPNEHQPAPTRISNLARPTSKRTRSQIC